MATKVKELEPNPMHKKADDPNCVICHPRPDRVPHDKVWRFSRANPGVDPFKPGTRV